MRRAVLCAVLVMVSVSSTFGGSTEDLRQAAMDINTTPETIERLIKAGANVNAKDLTGGTALISAAWLSNPEVVKALIKAGANVNAKDNHGITALTLAAAGGDTEIVKVLIKAGANVNVKANDGWTPLMSAAGSNIISI